jgi:predicted RNA-binding protein YlqC (UPF0109 family)
MNIEKMLKKLAQGLVNTEDAVEVEALTSGGFTSYMIMVAPGEAGMVIGRSGVLIESIRNWAYATATKQGERLNIEVQELRTSGTNERQEGAS